jgi:hypothetical protein
MVITFLYGQKIQANKEMRNELSSRACTLLLVMIAPLKGKTQEDVPPGLLNDLEKLTSYVSSV